MCGRRKEEEGALKMMEGGEESLGAQSHPQFTYSEYYYDCT
jgi:hypothetical protein